MRPLVFSDSSRMTRPEVTIGRDAWASVVASVSGKGEEDGRFYVAQAFHMDGHVEVEPLLAEPPAK